MQSAFEEWFPLKIIRWDTWRIRGGKPSPVKYISDSMTCQA